MKKTLPAIAILFITAFAFFSCSKDKASGSTKTASITSSTWVFSSASIDQNNDGVGDVGVPPSVLLPCYTDNTLTFSVNGTGSFDEGGSKCNAADPQTSAFTWSFTNGEQNINFSATLFPGASGDFKIIKLDASTLILSKLVTISGLPAPVTVIITFIH